MQNLFYTLEQYKTQARLLHSNMKEMKLICSYMQAMQLTAKSHGYKNWETLEKNVLNNTLCVNVNSSNELTLDIEKSNNVWISVKNISVCVTANDEGVSVDLYPLEQEDCESITSTYAFYDEAEDNNDYQELSEQELLLEWENANKNYHNTVRAYDIKKNYQQSSEKNMYNFQEYMIDNLIAECGNLFKNRNEAKEFLFKEDNDKIILPTYHTKEAILNYHKLSYMYPDMKNSEVMLVGEVREKNNKLSK